MKYYFISAILHGLLLVGTLSFQWGTGPSTSVQGGPMQVMILPDQLEIVDTPQVLKRVGPLKAKKKIGHEKKQKVNVSDQGILSKQKPNNKESGDGAPAGDGVKTLKASYAQALFLYFSQNKSYPRKARKLNQTGTVSVRIQVNANGVFEHIHLEKGCDHSTLNKAALQMIERLGKFKPLPKKLGSSRQFTVPIQYTMSRGV